MLLMTCILSACRFCPWCLLTFLADSDPARTVCLGLMQRLDPKGLEKLRKDCLGLFAGAHLAKALPFMRLVDNSEKWAQVDLHTIYKQFWNLCKGHRTARTPSRHKHEFRHECSKSMLPSRQRSGVPVFQFQKKGCWSHALDLTHVAA